MRILERIFGKEYLVRMSGSSSGNQQRYSYVCWMKAFNVFRAVEIAMKYVEKNKLPSEKYSVEDIKRI